MRNLGINVLFEGTNFIRILSGLFVTARIALVSVAFSMILGILFGMVMTGKNRLARRLCRLYLETIRLIPALVWLFIFYYGLFRNFRSGELVAILFFSLWGTAEMGDLVRGALTSLAKHQYESGHALGLTELQLQLYIIIPQVVRRLIPGAINLTTRMIKTTSLVVVIGVTEVLKVGQQVIEASYFETPKSAFWIYALIFFLYFILCAPISHFSKKLEQRWQS
ncbi:MAG: amino acid ABC transporter permease [Treponema sp.]|jgi:polar amino acid transport system permease protein|nr:amino acid ABC transporter permease [Treponema sp.]